MWIYVFKVPLSLLAASLLHSARIAFGLSPKWTKALEHMTGKTNEANNNRGEGHDVYRQLQLMCHNVVVGIE